MTINNLTHKTKDGITLVGKIYIPDGEVKAVVVIVHGMAEHSERYARFADVLNRSGYCVYAYDQRGHGKTAGEVEKLGFFAEKNGWQKVTEDLSEIVELAKQTNQHKKVIVFGHSMGSFITRNYLEQFPNKVSGVILSGTAGSAGLLGQIGILLTKFITLYKPLRSPSKLLNTLSFGDFNKTFKPVKTAFDWLSRDEAEVKKYVDDPYCGTIFSIGFFRDLLQGLEASNTKSHVQKITKGLKIHLLSGENDPVSKFGKQVKIVFDMYKSVSENVTMKLYPDGRHEMLNETNRDEVMTDLTAILDNMIR